MEMLAKRNPNMQRILTETRKKREEDLKEARDHLGEIQEALGLGNGHLSDDDLLEAAEAVEMMVNCRIGSLEKKTGTIPSQGWR